MVFLDFGVFGLLAGLFVFVLPGVVFALMFWCASGFPYSPDAYGLCVVFGYLKLWFEVLRFDCGGWFSVGLGGRLGWLVLRVVCGVVFCRVVAFVVARVVLACRAGCLLTLFSDLVWLVCCFC